LFTQQNIFIEKQDRQRTYNIVVRSRNHFYSWNATKCSLCIYLQLDAAVNNVNPLSVATETQEWVSFALLSNYKIFHTPDIFVRF
jgi:hypothetical protein